MNSTRVFNYLLLALLLLFAQQGAALHAYSHYQQQEKHAPTHKACDECASFAEMGGAVNSAPFTFDVAKGSFIAFATRTVVFEQSPSLAFSARAPPRFS